MVFTPPSVHLLFEELTAKKIEQQTLYYYIHNTLIGNYQNFRRAIYCLFRLKTSKKAIGKFTQQKREKYISLLDNSASSEKSSFTT